MKIRCLPLAGPENPYQRLMMAGLTHAGHQVSPGRPGRWWALNRTWLLDRPDALHLDWPARYYRRRHPLATALQAMAFWLDLTFFKLLGGTLVWTAHNLKEHDSPTPAWDARVQRWIAHRATRIRLMAAGQWADAAHHWGLDERAARERLRVCPEGGYQTHYPPAPPRDEARALLIAQFPPLAPAGSSDDAHASWVIHIGNLRPYKGTDRLIEAFRGIAPNGARLLIAGPPHDRAFVDRLQALAGADDRIVLLPRALPDHELALWHGAADLAALPFTRIDNSGTVVLAMGYGLPVVAPSAGAVGERLSHQPELLFPLEGGDAAFREALAHALTLTPDERSRIGTANRAQIERHSWEAFGGVFEGLD